MPDSRQFKDFAFGQIPLDVEHDHLMSEKQRKRLEKKLAKERLQRMRNSAHIKQHKERAEYSSKALLEMAAQEFAALPTGQKAATAALADHLLEGSEVYLVPRLVDADVMAGVKRIYDSSDPAKQGNLPKRLSELGVANQSWLDITDSKTGIDGDGRQLLVGVVFTDAAEA